jgi:hypothetical protein
MYRLIVAILAVAVAVSSGADPTTVDGDLPLADLPYYRSLSEQIEGGTIMLVDAGDSPYTVDPIAGPIKKKDGRLAFVLSLAVPGLGEYYAGSLWRGVPFAAAEVGLWTGYFVYDDKGDDQTEVYENFANVRWDEEDYWAWWNSLTPEQQSEYTHVLPETHTQQYYEMIGKYKQFFQFWDEYDSATEWSPYLGEYVDMRDQANRYYNKADTFVMISVANHLLSAFDAALTARRFNNKAEQERRLDVRFRIDQNGGSPAPQLTFDYRF